MSSSIALSSAALPGDLVTSSLKRAAAAQLIPLSASASSFPGAPHPYTLAQNGKDVHRTQSRRPRRQTLMNILP